MPRIATHACARILEWLELQTRLRDARGRSPCHEARTVGGDEVRHGPAFPDVSVQPEAAIHGVDHSVAARVELAVLEATLALCVAIR